jgi:hypothetical protein
MKTESKTEPIDSEPRAGLRIIAGKGKQPVHVHDMTEPERIKHNVPEEHWPEAPSADSTDTQLTDADLSIDDEGEDNGR